MQNRQRHQLEVEAFLQKHFIRRHWVFTLPQGSGNETYFASSSGQTYFVKLGVQTARYQTMASIGLAPEIFAEGRLEDDTSIIVQRYIVGGRPNRLDFQIHLEPIARTIRRLHHHPGVKLILPEASSEDYCSAGLRSLILLRERWDQIKALVSNAGDFVDESLAVLEQQVLRFSGKGLVAAHHDICSANWLISSDGQIYLIDFDSMSLDDPAVDLGAILWWYYPPALRLRFCEMAGYIHDDAFQFRMQVRMAMHCLSILMPRESSFDQFDPDSFLERLIDFKAILAGQENPQGYQD